MVYIELELTNKDIETLTKRRTKETFMERFLFCFFLITFIPCVLALIQLVNNHEGQHFPILGFLFLLLFCIIFGLATYGTIPTRKDNSKFSKAIIQNRKRIGELTLLQKQIQTYTESKDEYLFHFDVPNFTGFDKSIVDDYCYNKSKIGDKIEVEFIPGLNFFLMAKCNNINMLAQYSA